MRQLSQKVWPALRAKRPAAHASHAARPDSGWLRPASHARQTRAPAALLFGHHARATTALRQKSKAESSENLGDIVEEFLRHPAGLHDVRLLAQVLRDEEASAVEGRLAVMIHGAHDELGPIDVVE